MSPRARLIGATGAVIIATVLGVLAAWPIYRTWWLLVPAAVGLLLGAGIAWFGARRRAMGDGARADGSVGGRRARARGAGGLSLLATVGLLFAAFVVTVVPVAVPRSFDRLPLGPLNGLLDGVAAIVLGWKQLLTLSLPVGTYQAVMVPAYLVFLLSAFIAVTIALRGGRLAPFAAFPLMLPVAFGTVFGSSAVSESMRLWPFTVTAPRELGLWIATALLGAVWVWYSAGAERRAALRRGRAPGERSGRGRATRAAIGAATVFVALIAGVALAPVLDNGDRQVPRDRIDPEIVLREQTSPLASYRSWKRDAAFDTPVFQISSDGALPARLRLAVLDAYDGVDFHVSTDEAGRFTRFPSGDSVDDPATVTVRIEEGYRDIWVPASGLGSVPVFQGENASELADAFYVNRNTGAAIAVPGGVDTEGLTPGDGLQATMQTSADPQLTGGPASGGATVDLETVPELAAWLKAQDQPATAEGLTELIKRLRDRGYLSHSISDAEGSQAWLEALAAEYGTRFESSAGGHSLARIEQLFSQLNTQQRLAGENAAPEMLVAGIGDDEQFATAAALIARALGFDSRVVVGVRLGDGSATASGPGAEVEGVPSCESVCTGENLAAWVEVRGDQGVWVPLDVTPQVEMRPTTLEEGEQLPEFPTTPEERDAREVDPPLGLGERNEATDDTDDSDGASWVWPVLRGVGLSASALVLLAIPLLFLPFAKRRRSNARRSEPDPELKSLGAWQDMIDGATDAGILIPSGASREETAAALGTEPAKWAADTSARAVFSAGGVSEQDAEWMWAAVDADRAEREASMTRWQRVRAKYALRSYGVNLVKWRGRAAESAVASPDGGK